MEVEMERVIFRHLSGSNAGQTDEFPLEGANVLLFGRGPSADIRFDLVRDDLVGRQHAKLGQDPVDRYSFSLQDLASRNGTYLNNQRLVAPSRLSPGDVIQLGLGGPEVEFDLEPLPAHLMGSTRRSPSHPTRESAAEALPAAASIRSLVCERAETSARAISSPSAGRRGRFYMASAALVATASIATAYILRVPARQLTAPVPAALQASESVSPVPPPIPAAVEEKAIEAPPRPTNRSGRASARPSLKRPTNPAPTNQPAVAPATIEGVLPPSSVPEPVPETASAVPETASAVPETFSKVKLIVASGDKTRERAVQLKIRGDRLEIVDEKLSVIMAFRCTTTAATYLPTTADRINRDVVDAATTVLGPIAIPARFADKLFGKRVKHLLLLGTGDEAAVLRLDKNNYELILAALEKRGGMTIQRKVSQKS
jgi:hypothetical protein